MTTNCGQVFPLCLSRKRIAFPNYLSKKKGSPRLSWTSGLPLVVVTSQRTQIVSSPVPQSHCGRRLRAVPGRQRKRPTYDSPFHPACRGKGNHGNMFSRLPPVVVTSHHYNSYSSRSASQERPLGGAPSKKPQKDPQSGPGAPKPKTHQCCSKLILERPRLRSAPLGASLGLLGLPGRLLGPPAASWVPPVAKLGKKLVPTCSPPTADVTTCKGQACNLREAPWLG